MIICIFLRVLLDVPIFDSFLLFIKIKFTLTHVFKLITVHYLPLDLYSFVIILHICQHILSASPFLYSIMLLFSHFTFLSFGYHPLTLVSPHQKLSIFIQATAVHSIVRSNYALKLISLHPYCSALSYISQPHYDPFGILIDLA